MPETAFLHITASLERTQDTTQLPIPSITSRGHVSIVLTEGPTIIKKQFDYPSIDTVEKLKASWQRQMSMWLNHLKNSLTQRTLYVKKVSISLTSEIGSRSVVTFQSGVSELNGLKVEVPGLTDLNAAHDAALTELAKIINHAESHYWEYWPT